MQQNRGFQLASVHVLVPIGEEAGIGTRAIPGVASGIQNHGGRVDRRFLDDIAQHVIPAVTVDERISAAVASLEKAPGIGRPGRVEGTRELVIDRTPYIAAYSIAGDIVRVLRMLHGAQLWPEEIPERHE